MASVNKVILIGNLGKDPEVRYTPTGAAVCNISIATTRTWKDKTSGERMEETEWHRISLFDRMAENAGQYLKKGSPVYIEGRLRTRKWKDKEGIERYVTEIMADSMQFLAGRNEAGEGGAPAPAPAASRAPGPRPAPAPRPSTGFDDMDDDIPFITSCHAFDMESRLDRRVRRGSCR